eukprot:scaffold34403_cov53-Phaeocystis_antarctica.AAC.2
MAATAAETEVAATAAAIPAAFAGLPRKSQWGKLTTTLAQGGHTGLHRRGTMSDSSSGPAPQRQLSHSKAGRQA